MAKKEKMTAITIGIGQSSTDSIQEKKNETATRESLAKPEQPRLGKWVCPRCGWESVEGGASLKVGKYSHNNHCMQCLAEWAQDNIPVMFFKENKE